MSDAADVKFDYAEITRATSVMGTKLDDISDELSNLRDEVDALLKNGMVFDQASPALTEAYTQFTQQLTESAGAIKQYAETFESLSKGMQDSDSDIAQAVRANMQ